MLENTAFIKSAPAGVKATIQNTIKNFARKVREVFAMLTGGNRESRALRELRDGMYRYVDSLQKLWDVAAEEMVSGEQVEQGAETVQVEDVQFSLREVDGQQVVWVEENVLNQREDGESVASFIQRYIKSHIGELYTIIESGSKVYLGGDLPGKYTHSEYMKQLYSHRRDLYSVKMQAAQNLGELIEIASNRRWEKTKHQHNKDAKYGIYKYDSRIAFPAGNKVKSYTVELLILNASDGKKYLYDVQNIKRTPLSHNALYFKGRRRSLEASPRTSGALNDSVLQSAESVNSKRQFALRDTKYLNAVEAGDTAEAQRMVDEAAEQLVNGEKVEQGAKDAKVKGNIMLALPDAVQNPVAVFDNQKTSVLLQIGMVLMAITQKNRHKLVSAYGMKNVLQ